MDLSAAPPNDETIARALTILRGGGLIGLPTETVYGLAADATSAGAVARIYAAKGRPIFNPLISHVAGRDAALREGRFNADAIRLADAFWPGPLTLVVPRHPEGTVCDLACAGLATIGLRVPAHPVARALLERYGAPLAAPSANRSGRISPTTPADVTADLGAAVDLVLDGGACAVGLESTIIACVDGGVTLLRPGGIAAEAIAGTLGRTLETPHGEAVMAPGMLASHYAPRARLRLGAFDVGPNEVGLDFAGRLATRAALDLSPRGDVTEAAAHLYAYLRQLDSAGAATIAVAPVPESGLGAAINDRLRRAAAPRDPATA